MNLEASAGLADFEAANPYFAQVNALVGNPDVSLYFSPQQLSYGAVRDLIATAIADVTANGRPIEEVAAELEEAANAAHEEAME